MSFCFNFVLNVSIISVTVRVKEQEYQLGLFDTAGQVSVFVSFIHTKFTLHVLNVRFGSW